MGCKLLALGKTMQIIFRFRLGISIVAGPDKTGLVEDAEGTQKVLNCGHEVILDVGVLNELHAVVKQIGMNRSTDMLLVGLGLLSKNECVIILTHGVLILPQNLVSIL
jgi:hypothetical protein